MSSVMLTVLFLSRPPFLSTCKEKATTKALYFPPDSTSDKGGKKMAKRWQQGKQQRWQKRWQKRKQQKVAKRWQKVAKREQKRWQKRKQKRWKKVAKPHLLSIAMHLKSGDNWTTSAHLRSGQKSTHLRNCHLHLPNIFCIVGTITYVLCFCTCQIYCRHNYLCFMFLNLPDILYCRHNYFVSRFCNCQIFLVVVGTITYVLCFCTCQIYCRHNYLCFMFLNLPDILYCRHNYFVSRFCTARYFFVLSTQST